MPKRRASDIVKDRARYKEMARALEQKTEEAARLAGELAALQTEHKAIHDRRCASGRHFLHPLTTYCAGCDVAAVAEREIKAQEKVKLLRFFVSTAQRVTVRARTAKKKAGALRQVKALLEAALADTAPPALSPLAMAAIVAGVGSLGAWAYMAAKGKG